ncbi:hypothetical protein FQZ97_450790 [compost metagenome]
MKKLITLLLTATTLAGCNAEIDHAETTIRNGLIYKYGETDPFTGLVLNTPVGLPGISALCNSQIENGRHSGKSKCFYNSQKVYEVEYLAGNKDGAEQVFDAKTGDKISVKNWKNGRQDGIAEEYQNGVLTHQQEFKDGKPDGKETRWSEDGKTVRTKLTWRTGNKQEGFLEDSEGKYNYLNGQLHGTQLKYGYIVGNLKRYTSAEENYDDGKLDGVQKKFVNTLHTDIVQQGSEVIYDKGIAISGWMRKLDPTNGSLIQEIKLVRPAKTEDENFRSEYPGNLVPDGVVTQRGDDSSSEEVWTNGRKIKYRYANPYTYGDDVFYILDIGSGYETYKEVSKAEYVAYGASSSRGSSLMKSQPDSIANSESCIDSWITAYRNETGEDALVNREQLDEWDDWCKEGKAP